MVLNLMRDEMRFTAPPLWMLLVTDDLSSHLCRSQLKATESIFSNLTIPQVPNWKVNGDLNAGGLSAG